MDLTEEEKKELKTDVKNSKNNLKKFDEVQDLYMNNIISILKNNAICSIILTYIIIIKPMIPIIRIGHIKPPPSMNNCTIIITPFYLS